MKPVFPLFLLVLSLSAFADQITMQNGDILTGKIVTADAKAVILKTTYAGDIKIDRALITGIMTTQLLNLSVKDQERIQAKVASTENGLRLEAADGTVTTIASDALLSLRDDLAQKAWDREQERINDPRLNDFWAGYVSIGLATASGNTRSTTVNNAAAATRTAGKNKIALNFSQLYARSSTLDGSGSTANSVSGGFRIDRDISKRLFVFGTNAYDYDKFQQLDLRAILGAGLSYHAWKRPKGFLDFGSGGNWNHEKFATQTGPLIRNSGEVMMAQIFNYKPYRLLNFSEKLDVFSNLTASGEYRANLDAMASVPLRKWLDWNVRFSNRYISNPLPGNRPTDTVLTVGIRASFDQTRLH